MKEKKTLLSYTKVPTSLSLSVLERFLSEKELAKLKKSYIDERNKSFEKRGGNRGHFCPHCGKKLPKVTP